MTPNIDRYFSAAKEAGCPLDQIQRFANAGIVLQPQQLRFAALARLCDVQGGPDDIAYGGAVGGGKSFTVLAVAAVDDCQRFSGLKVLLLRKVGSAGLEGFNDLRVKVLAFVPHEFKQTGGGVCSFPNGSRIVLGHFKDETDVDKYLGLEYDVIIIEERTTLSASKIAFIRTRLRTSKPGWRVRMYSTTNPGGVGHADFKQTFIVPWKRGAEKDTRFVPATYRDNAFLPAEYGRSLDKLTGWRRRAFKDGDWDIAAGMFFTNWSEERHVREFEIEPGERYWLGFDHGFNHPTSSHVIFKRDGAIHVLDEHFARKKLPNWHAEQIIEMLGRHTLTPQGLYGTFAGTDVFAKRADSNDLTIADQYSAGGLKFTSAVMDRINGAGRILTLLGDEGEVPSLYVHPRCTRLIECLPSLVHDPHRPEDVLKVDANEDGEGGDDAYDDLRYGVMADQPPEFFGFYGIN